MVEAEITTLVDEKPEKAIKNIMKPRSFGARKEPSEFEERVIEIRRVARTVKGGRRMRFRALVVIGNRKGKVGMGMAKANDVAEAVKKAVTQAKKELVLVPTINGTIPYEVVSKHGGAVVMLKPASSGTSIVAGGAVRAVAELVGITDLLSKMQGSPSKVNNVKATIAAFSTFNPEYTARVQKYADNQKTAIAPKDEIKVEEEAEPATSKSPSSAKATDGKPKTPIKKSVKKVAKK